MRNWRTVALVATCTVAMSGLALAGQGTAGAATITPYTVSTDLMDGSGKLRTVDRSVVGDVKVSAAKKSDGYYVSFEISSRKSYECLALGDTDAAGLSVEESRNWDSIREHRQKGFFLNSSGNGRVELGPFKGDRRIHVGGSCSTYMKGNEAFAKEVPGSTYYRAYLTEPKLLYVDFAGTSGTPTDPPREPNSPPPSATTPPREPNSPQKPQNRPLTYKDCAPIAADSLTEGRWVTDPITGALSAAMKVVCGQVAYFNGDEKLQLELLCEGFIDASVGLIPGPDMSFDFFKAAGVIAKQWPQFDKAINDRKCKGRDDYPKYTGAGGGGW